MSKSKISIGNPMVVQALGTYNPVSQPNPVQKKGQREGEEEKKNTHINNTRHMSLDRRTTQQQINLIIIVAIAPQILDDPEGSLAVSHSGIQIMLFALLIDTETLEINVSSGTEIRFHGAGDVDGRFHVQVLDPLLHDGELDRDDAGHFDGAAEADFAVALGEVEVADREFCPRDVDGEVDF